VADEPFAENAVGPFAIFGYLDLRADTQWVRLMPIRRNLIPTPDPIDAIVTLEHLGTGRVVMLRDSLFAFTDGKSGGVGYAHNFWTTGRSAPAFRRRKPLCLATFPPPWRSGEFRSLDVTPWKRGTMAARAA
jgi:hypothetical protein